MSRTIQVELLSTTGWMRPVEILDDGDLNSVFHYGQNDFQPLRMPSVSVGDVIHWGDRKILVRGTVMDQMTEREYNNYKAMDRMDRTDYIYKRL